MSAWDPARPSDRGKAAPLPLPPPASGDAGVSAVLRTLSRCARERDGRWDILGGRTETFDAQAQDRPPDPLGTNDPALDESADFDPRSLLPGWLYPHKR